MEEIRGPNTQATNSPRVPMSQALFPGREEDPGEEDSDAEIPFVNIVNTSARTIFKSNLKELNKVRFDCWCHYYFVISV